MRKKAPVKFVNLQECIIYHSLKTPRPGFNRFKNFHHYRCQQNVTLAGEWTVLRHHRANKVPVVLA